MTMQPRTGEWSASSACMTTSLYHSLKSLARGVILCAWAITLGPLVEESLSELRDGHPLFGAGLQVPHDHLAGRPLVGPDDDGPRRSPRRGKLELFADGRRPEAVLHRGAQIAQLVRQLQYRRHVFAAHRYQKGVELRRRLVGRAALLQKLSEDDVSHAEPEGGEIGAAERLQQPVVAAAAAHGP